MNLWARRIRLLSLAAFSFFSCEEENTIGLPPEDNLGIFFAEIPMGPYVEQVWINDLPYDESGLLLVGAYNDPELGQIEATAFSDLSTTAIRTSFPKSDSVTYEFVSASMTLRIRNGYGITSGSPQVGIGIYQITDTVDINRDYTNSDAFALNQKIGEAQFTFYPDSLGLERNEDSDQSIKDIPASLFDADSIYIYTTDFDLEQSFWESTFNQYVEDVLLDTLNFPDSTLNPAREFDLIVKGIALTMESGNTAIQYNGSDLQSSIRIQYNRVAPSGTIENEIIIIINPGKAFNEIQPNANSGWTLEKFSPLVSFYEGISLDDQNAYIQSGANLFMALDFEPMRSFADTAVNAVFQRAELYINGDSTLVLEGNDPISQLQFLLSSDATLEDEELAGIPDVNFAQELPIAIIFNEADSNFVRMPTYLNQLLLNRTTLDKIIVRGPSVSSLDRLVIPKDSIFLRLYYSKTN
ncbi:MAG: DUF4270 family protein [Bacteroidota bacterium]